MLYDKLDYVLMIAEERNLTKASKRLYVSQPALTSYLNRLEVELGVKLFDRTKTPVEITPAGEYYISEMKKVSAAERQIRSALKVIEEPTRTLIIGTGQVRGYNWLPAILPTFCEMHPDVNVTAIQATESHLVEQLQQSQLDMVFGAYSVPIKGLVDVPLTEDSIVFIAHRKYGIVPQERRRHMSSRNPYALEDSSVLNGLPFISPGVSNGLWVSYEQLIAAHNLHPSRTIAVNNLMTGLELTKEGLGIQLGYSALLEVNWQSHKDVSNLDFFTIRDMSPSRLISALYSEHNVKKNLILDMIRILKNEHS